MGFIKCSARRVIRSPVSFAERSGIADMCREIMTQSPITARLMNHSIVAQLPQQEPEIDFSPPSQRSSPLPSPLPTTDAASCETASDLSSPTSADILHTRSDNTPFPCQHPQSTSHNLISDQDISIPTVAHFVTEFSLSGLPAHSKFLLSVEGGQISAQLRCDYCVNDEARLDEPQLKKRNVTYIDLAGRWGSKGE
ncbi:hypothetical protein B0O99DRAFT_638876 [Bisporella sp. PMI_857]|nr:hypothetical protein B0O99DRAFT_638876 [Bisporella sp. PMI_857]